MHVLSTLDLHLPLNQPSKEIKTITITLQLPHSPRRPIIPPQLLRQQQPIIPRDPLNPRPNTPFLLQRNHLVQMQPVVVVHLLEGLVEARAQEPRIQVLVGGDDAREELLQRDRGEFFVWEEAEGERG